MPKGQEGDEEEQHQDPVITLRQKCIALRDEYVALTGKQPRMPGKNEGETKLASLERAYAFLQELKKQELKKT